MTVIGQEIDAIIEEEKLEPGITPDEPETSPKEDPPTPVADDTKKEEEKKEPEDGGEPTPDGTEPAEEPKKEEEEAPVPTPEPEKPVVTEEPTKPASQVVEEAKGVLGDLNLTADKLYDETGRVKEFETIVPPGAFFASKLAPVKVVDKEGKTHEFLLISDVEKAFPDGFEAKNNIEQLKFERGIMSNENKFEQAVGEYNGLKSQFQQEATALITSQAEQSRIASEYKTMADMGMVPKLDKSPNDPAFAESDAVKELDRILEWRANKNAELKKQGLGEITSLFVAKQLMGQEITNDPAHAEAEKKKQDIIEQRKKAASLSAAPPSNASSKDDKEKQAAAVKASLPMSSYIETLIEDEGIK